MEKAVDHLTILEDIILVKMDSVPKNSLFIADIFNIIASHQVDIDMISQILLEDEAKLEITCDHDAQKPLNEALKVIVDKYKNIVITQNRTVSKVLVEGEGMRNTPGVAAGLFEVFGKLNVYIMQVTTSLTSISYLVDKKDLNKVVEALKTKYEL